MNSNYEQAVKHVMFLIEKSEIGMNVNIQDDNVMGILKLVNDRANTLDLNDQLIMISETLQRIGSRI